MPRRTTSFKIAPIIQTSVILTFLQFGGITTTTGTIIQFGGTF
jgi:hypothetical protein